ncbi:CMD-domain-containing protein [Hysterangium stoloniferum]|nr:CMD-domain-containing protein [Hysterangium stoloniferum]
MTTSDGTQKDIPNSDAHAELYHAGIAMRRQVMGNEYVDNQLNKGVSQFAQPMQQLVSEIAWGTIWTRPGLELKQRSLINIALLASQNHPLEVNLSQLLQNITLTDLLRKLAGHIRGAVNNGVTEIEIRETLLQTAVYCGVPTGMASFRVGDETIQKLKDEGKLPK